MSYAAVVFDFFGTLTPDTPSHVWDAHAARSASPLGISPTVWRAALDSSFHERLIGTLGDLPQTFRTLARQCGVEPDEMMLASACAARMDAQRELFVLRGDALPTLRLLRARGLRVGVLSNCTIELVDAWPSLPLAALVEMPVFSCVEGRRKPDPILYKATAQRLGVQASSCLYVSDGDGRELAGASVCNMTAVMLGSVERVDRDVRRGEDEWPGRSIESLSMVPKLLEEELGFALSQSQTLIRRSALSPGIVLTGSTHDALRQPGEGIWTPY
jgi:putative hydrolase of the HAD superfamily